MRIFLPDASISSLLEVLSQAGERGVSINKLSLSMDLYLKFYKEPSYLLLSYPVACSLLLNGPEIEIEGMYTHIEAHDVSGLFGSYGTVHGITNCLLLPKGSGVFVPKPKESILVSLKHTLNGIRFFLGRKPI